MRCETEMEQSDEDCPRCHATLAHVEYVRYVQSSTVGEPVGHVRQSVLADWHECVECGWLSTDMMALPEGARESLVAALY